MAIILVLVPFITVNVIAADVIVPGSSGGFSINLTTGTLTVPSSYEIKSYSINDGKTWKDDVGKFKNNFQTLISKGMTLHLSDRPIAKNTKKPDDNDIIKFPTVKKNTEKYNLVVNYSKYADNTGATTGEWCLTTKTGGTPTAAIEVADTNEKKQIVGGYKNFSGTSGIPVKELPLDSKKAIVTYYYVRFAAKNNGGGTYTAASAPRLLKVQGEGSIPSVYGMVKGTRKVEKVVNNKVVKETISIRQITLAKGDIILAGNNPGPMPVRISAAPANFCAGDAFLAEKNLKNIMTLEDCEYQGIMLIWKSATDKKPASAALIYDMVKNDYPVIKFRNSLRTPGS